LSAPITSTGEDPTSDGDGDSDPLG
jgi:hypothetical protein